MLSPLPRHRQIAIRKVRVMRLFFVLLFIFAQKYL
jgi:hypothetical protein